jgi:hypothetical protein
VGWILDLDGCIGRLYDVAITTLKLFDQKSNTFLHNEQDSMKVGDVVKNK